MARYIIIGAGAVGASLAAQFEAVGTDYVLVGRGAQIRRLRDHGLNYVVAGRESVVPLRTADGADAVELRTGDVLVVTTKSQDIEEIARDWAWRPVVGGAVAGGAVAGGAVAGGDAGSSLRAADLPIVAVQNGLDSERVLLRRFGRVYGGSLLTPARYTELGEVVVGSATVGVITLGRFPTGIDETARTIASDLRAAGYVIQLTDDVRRWKAAKLLHSVKNGLEVLAGTDEERARYGALVTEEARAVFAAAGIDAADAVAERTEDVSGFRVDPSSGIRAGQQSTWQSFARGAGSTEVDHLNGEIVLLGRLHGVPTPVNERVQAVLGALTADGGAPGSVSFEALRDVDAARIGSAAEAETDRAQAD